MSDEHYEAGQDPSLEAALYEFLAARSVVTLAVADAGGPWAAAVFFANAGEVTGAGPSGFDFYFVSSPQTRHGAALLADPRCAATVQDHPDEPLAIRGVQLAGTVSPVAPARAPAAFARYAAKFPFVHGLYRVEEQAWVIGGRRIEEPFWLFSASDVYWIDNSHGFGRRRHIRLGGGGWRPRPGRT